MFQSTKDPTGWNRCPEHPYRYVAGAKRCEGRPAVESLGKTSRGSSVALVMLNVPTAIDSFPACALVYAENATGWHFVQAFVSTPLPKLKSSDNLLIDSVLRHVLRVVLSGGLVSVRSSTDAPQATILYDLNNGSLQQMKVVPYPPEPAYDDEVKMAAELAAATPGITASAGSNVYYFKSENDLRTGTLSDREQYVLDNGQAVFLIYLFPMPNDDSHHGVSLVYSYVNGAWVYVPLPTAPADQDQKADARYGQLDVQDAYHDASGTRTSNTVYEVDGTKLVALRRSEGFNPAGSGF